MAYTKKTWKGGDAVTPSSLNNMENGISLLDTRVGSTDIASVGSTLTGAIKNNNTAILLLNRLEDFSNASDKKSKWLYNVSLDTVNNNGIYAIDSNTCTSLPEVSNGILLVQSVGTKWLRQTILSLATNNNVYTRACNNGTWTSWQRLVTESDRVIETFNTTSDEYGVIYIGSKSGYTLVNAYSDIWNIAVNIFKYTDGYRGIAHYCNGNLYGNKTVTGTAIWIKN